MMKTSVQRTNEALQVIADAGGEGARIFTKVYTESAKAEAAAADARAVLGISLSPIDGRIVSIKDLFDVAGEPTTAGSKARRDVSPAKQDAVIVQRLRSAGAVIIGKTNMTEFALSGIGINPHYGTPGNARDVTRIPGGSSSGSGVAVARGMCEISIGSDTGGSIRIPSALNGVTGFKPTQARVTREGAFPLSYSLDTVGPLANNVLDCAKTDAVLAGEKWAPLVERKIDGLRIGIPRGLLFTHADDQVLKAFDAAVETLRSSGANVKDIDLDELLGAPFKLQEKGTLVGCEAAQVHSELFASGKDDEVDPMVKARIVRGQTVPASHYISVLRARTTLQSQLDAAIANFDILVLPTVPVVAPTIQSLSAAEEFNRTNLLMLRNPSVFNFYDLPASSLPLPRSPQEPAIGFMVVGKRNADHDLLSIAQVISATLR